MSFKAWLGEQKSKMSDGITKFTNKDFMEAVAAGCALIAFADGTITSEEKQKMVGYIQLNDALKVFKLADILARFSHYTDAFSFDYVVGKTEAMKAICKLKSRPEGGKLLVSLCCAIGAADGSFDAAEVSIAKEICRELGLNTKQFDLD